MNHSEKLKSLYNLSFSVDDIQNIPQEYRDFIKIIALNTHQQKGVYTVLVTLLTHKILYPQQDIRCHQSQMLNGFSGRTIDTEYITPTLKFLQLPSMSESGWLTRSLEQPYPYTLDYQGKISNKKVKCAFLHILDYIEKNPLQAESILRLLLNQVIYITKQNQVLVSKLIDAEGLTIIGIIDVLKKHFEYKYHGRGSSRLPVLAIYALYQSLIIDLKRYEDKTLKPLGSHTASDKTSKTAGDIEIIDLQGNLFEAFEIKQDREIDLHMLRIAYEKIKKYNVQRYYILSLQKIKPEEESNISKFIQEIKQEHGCQVIVNGVLPSLKYSLRLISSLEKFVNDYSELLESESVIQKQHKEKWNELLDSFIK